MVYINAAESIYGGEERAGCFTLFVFLVSFDCYVALPHGAMDWFAVCGCISWPYSHAIFVNLKVQQLIYLIYHFAQLSQMSKN